MLSIIYFQIFVYEVNCMNSYTSDECLFYMKGMKYNTLILGSKIQFKMWLTCTFSFNFAPNFKEFECYCYI